MRYVRAVAHGGRTALVIVGAVATIVFAMAAVGLLSCLALLTALR